MNDLAFLTDLAARYGTPAYVYDLGAARRAARALTEDLPPGARLLYSLKANPHPLLVEALLAEGLDAEVSSPGEVGAAVAAGCPPQRLLYTGPGKTARELDAALRAGVRHFSVESPTDRLRLSEAAAAQGTDCDYLVRLNSPAGSGGGSLRMTGKPTAFGVDTGDLPALRELFTPRGPARPTGVHTFFATNVATEEALLAEFAQALRTVSAVCDDSGFTPRTVDLGGGFPAPSAVPGSLVRHPDLSSGLGQELDRHLPGWREGTREVVFESGRYLVATAGTLLTQVLDVKRSRGRSFTVLDAGVNALGGMSGLGRLMSPAVRPYPLADGRRPDPGPESTTVVGPLCTPLDILNGSVSLPGTRPGDLLAIPNVGAYGLTASLLGFLGHPAPVEIVHDGGEVVSARRLTLTPVEVPSRP